MQIAGLQKISLLDYPDKISSVVFTQGCNFICPFCHNPELTGMRGSSLNASHNPPLIPPLLRGGAEKLISPLVSGEADHLYINEKDFFKHLDERKGFIDGVCITGGEPLMQKDIADFIKKVKERGLLVKLDTNGSYPDKLRNLIKQKILDYIAMDIKNTFSNKYSEASGVNVDLNQIKKSIKLIMDSGLGYEFRTTVVKELHKKENILEIAEYINGARKYVLQKFEIRDKIMDRSFINYSSITTEEALELKKECSQFVEKVELRGWGES
ncbi:anaerobic ribonucleoside-triphosphate reductase activating protein [Patescibacteria group bacterium]